MKNEIYSPRYERIYALRRKPFKAESCINVIFTRKNFVAVCILSKIQSEMSGLTGKTFAKCAKFSIEKRLFLPFQRKFFHQFNLLRNILYTLQIFGQNFHNSLRKDSPLKKSSLQIISHKFLLRSKNLISSKRT